jgi:hypothetical protein
MKGVSAYAPAILSEPCRFFWSGSGVLESRVGILLQLMVRIKRKMDRMKRRMGIFRPKLKKITLQGLKPLEGPGIFSFFPDKQNKSHERTKIISLSWWFLPCL